MAHSPSGFNEAMCRNHLALLHAEQGEHELAVTHHRRAREVLLGASDSQWLAGLYQGEATNALWQGRPEDAARSIAECLDAVEQAERLFVTARLYELGVRACAELVARAPGDRPERERQLAVAQALLARLDARLSATDARWPIVLAARAGCAAEIARITGVDGIELWSNAEHSWEQLGDRYLAAYAQWRGAEAGFARGERERAEDLARRAFSTSSSIGATPLAQEISAFALRARFELVDKPGDMAGNRAIERLELTARELEVLTLLASGRTNREIAAQLVISDKTARPLRWLISWGLEPTPRKRPRSARGARRAVRTRSRDVPRRAVGSPAARCPVARSWEARSRDARVRRGAGGRLPRTWRRCS
jgi:ATP/maltotriose-dependent transcriptional regulator MalT